MGVIISFVVSGYQYREAKQREFYATLWNKRLELYLHTSDTAGEIAAAKSLNDAAVARQRFDRLYYGPLSVVEDKTVKTAMQHFRDKLVEKESPEHADNDLRQPSYQLACAMRDSLAQSWDRPFEFLSEPVGEKAP